MSRKLRVAIVHEWLVNYAGSERVVEQFLKIYPDADLFAVVDFLEPHERGFLGGRTAKTTFIQKLPKAKNSFRSYLPLMPLAIEQLDLSGYDLILSSSHAVSKGVLTGPDQVHVSYVHSPIRYAWDLQHQYLEESNLTKGLKSWLARCILHYVRLWDYRTANGVDKFLANSKFIARRVRKVYGRSAEVIYPPVDTENFFPGSIREDFYLVAGRMAPYKKVPLLVEAFAGMPDKKLVVIGDGPDMERVKSLATSNVKVMGFQSFEVLRDHMQRAKAFVFAAEEDFGIAPVEAQACGTPVIAFGRGGALETVKGMDSDAPTGLFFHEQTVSAIQAAVTQFEDNQERFTRENCQTHASRFAPDRFRREVEAAVTSALTDHTNR